MVREEQTFYVWYTPEDGWGARVAHGTPYRYLSAFADTPQDALRELVEIVMPLAALAAEETS